MLDGYRAKLSLQNVSVAKFTAEFSAVIKRLRSDLVTLTESSATRLEGQEVLEEFISGLIDASLFENPAVDPIFLPVFTMIYNTQNELISEMHAFMREAAALLGLDPDIVQLDLPEIFKLAKGVDSVSRIELEKYVDVWSTIWCLCVSLTKNAKSSLHKYVELAERIRGDEEAAEFVRLIWKGFQE
jgi:hypothetical protein